MQNKKSRLTAAALTQIKDPITRVSKVMKKGDGTEFRIVGDLCIGFSETSVDYYFHRRQSPEHPWELLSKDPHPDWRTMSVDEYTKRGRSPLLQALRFPELFKLMDVLKLLGRPMSEFDDATGQMAASSNVFSVQN